jgi:hypothetical protein
MPKKHSAAAGFIPKPGETEVLAAQQRTVAELRTG